MNSDFSNAQRAEVLTQALPYIKRYNSKIVVVKYGGNAMINEQLKQQVMEDIVLLWLIGIKIVLVHGGGPEISDLMGRLGKKAEFVDGLRVTDKETADIVQMVLAGKVNKTLVNLLEMKGGRAMGISGMDGRLIEAEIKDERLGYVGRITSVNITPINDLLEKGYIPVVSTVGCDRQGNNYNINGDTAAAFISGALHHAFQQRDHCLFQFLRQGKFLGKPKDKFPCDPGLSCCSQAFFHGLQKPLILLWRHSHPDGPHLAKRP